MREPRAPVDRLRFERLELPQDVHAVSPSLDPVVQARGPGELRLSYLDGTVINLTSPQSDPFHRMDFTPDGRFLMLNRTQACHLESAEWVEFPATGHTSSSHAFLLGDRVAMAQGSGLVEIFDLCNGERLEPLRPDPAAVGRRAYLAVSSSSDLARVAISLDNTLYLYDADEDRWDGSWRLEESLIGLCFSPGARWLALLAIQRNKQRRPAQILFWDRVTRRIAATADSERAFCFSPVHPLMAVGTPEGAVEILAMDWSLLRDGKTDFQTIARMEAAGPVHKLEFVAHGHFLAVTTNAGVGLWKVVLPESTVVANVRI